MEHDENQNSVIKDRCKRYTVVTVTVLKGRNISVGFFHDLIDIPDPKVHLKCADAVGRTQFTTSIAENQKNPEWNESFTFFMLDSCQNTEIEVALYEEDDYQRDPLLGSSTICTNDLYLNEPKILTFDYRKHGSLDVKVLKSWSYLPDVSKLGNLTDQEVNKFLIKELEIRSKIKEEDGELGCQVKDTLRYLSVAVKVIRGRNISVGFFHDLFDVPDPQVYVQCKSSLGQKHYHTKVAKNQINPEWNEMFVFTLEEDTKNPKLQIDLYEEDSYKIDPHLGTSTILINDLDFGSHEIRNLKFGKHGAVEIELMKQWRIVPDYRLTEQLSGNDFNLRVARFVESKVAKEEIWKRKSTPRIMREKIKLSDEDQKWVKKEQEYQAKINDIKVDYSPCMTVSVCVVRGTNISVSFLHDLVDVPDPQVYVKCDNAIGKQKFKTKIAQNQVNPEWNETFTFILPENDKESLIQIELYDEDHYKHDPYLGSSTVNAQDLELGKPKTFYFNYGKHGELEVKITKRWRTSPDFRLSLGLSEEEINYRIARKPKTKVALEEFLGAKDAPKNLGETPTIALAVTGGGYRAVAASCGAMEALAECELLNTLMYIAGLSGSSWYISSSYLHRSIKNLDSLIKHHDWLRKRMESSLFRYFFDISFFTRFKNYRKYKTENHQPVTFVDYYGLSLGETYLGKSNVDATFSHLKDYVATSDVPFPIISCAHVKEDLPMSEFWEEVEMSPFEVSLPAYAINVPTEKFNSRWGCGIIQDKLPEPPLHYVMGASGSAFAIMTNKIKDKNEIDPELMSYIESQQPAPHHLTVNSQRTSTSCEEDTADGDALYSPRHDTKNFASSEDDWLEYIDGSASKKTETDSVPQEGAYGNRGSFLQRTAKIRNIVSACKDLIKYRFNTEHTDKKHSNAGRGKAKISVDNTTMSLCDSALGCNVPSIHVLRPQRTVDVLMIVDCSNYKEENSLQLETFATVQSQVHYHGIKFPRISIEQISKDPFREFYIFEDERDPECPIVLWFTLANSKFKQLQKPHRRPGYPKPDAADSGQEKFNNFSIFPESSDFGTLRVSFSALNFDRLRELMRFNVLKNIWVVKEKIANKVKQMRTRMDENGAGHVEDDEKK